MNNNSIDIYELIAKSFNKTITKEESLIVEKWKAESDDNLSEYADYQFLWEQSEIFKYPSEIDVPRALAITRLNAAIQPKKTRWLTYAVQVAAVLVLSLIFSGIYRVFLSPKPVEIIEETIAYQEIRAAYGTQSQVTLPDGSLVFINSGSVLRFPVSFAGMKTRLVNLSGEGCFVVNSNKEYPFVIETGNLQIEALGTTFNVDAYDGSSVVTIALIEGEVGLQHAKHTSASDIILLKPNQVANFNKNDNKVLLKSESDMYKYTAWTDGKIVFYNDHIDNVINKLSNWYNVDITLADEKLKNYRFTGTFINEPVEQVLSILNLTSAMTYRILPFEKNSDNSYTKRKIILRSK